MYLHGGSAPRDPHHRGRRRWLASRARLPDRVEEPLGRADSSNYDGATRTSGKRLSSGVRTASPPRAAAKRVPQQSRARFQY
jgi:hypothetical protein